MERERGKGRRREGGREKGMEGKRRREKGKGRKWSGGRGGREGGRGRKSASHSSSADQRQNLKSHLLPAANLSKLDWPMKGDQVLGLPPAVTEACMWAKVSKRELK
jgi:hypothetical protein